jgi:hypothetical protein
MTYYRQNIANTVNAFVDITKSEFFVVKPCAAINKIENSSFEAPEYNDDGTLRQYNWDYTDSSAFSNISVYPITFHHAYSGSFAWKSKMSLTAQSISYGKSRGVQRTVDQNNNDILSFYCYCVEDGPTYNNSNVEYSKNIESRDVEFQLNVYGMPTSIYDSTKTYTLLSSKKFTLTSLPKDMPGDVVNGVSGSKTPYFHPWSRVELNLPHHDGSLLNSYFYFTIARVSNNPLSTYPLFDTYFVIDGVQCEEQLKSKKATMYFDGSYEGFNIKRYPNDFQFTGQPYKSSSIRSPLTRVSGEIVDVNDYCNFYTKSIDGLSTPSVETAMYSKTLRDGQHFVEQIIRNGKFVISGRIVAENQQSYMNSFTRLQELIGKKPFSDTEPVRIFLRLEFTTGKTLLPIYFDAVYESGLEMDTKNIFQEDINITFQMISTHVHFQNDSSSNMFNDSPLFDQFNTMNSNMIRDIAGLVYYNKTKEMWESPGGIGIFKVTDTTYTSTFTTGTAYQQYDTKTYYTVGDVYATTQDKDGIIWIGGRFDMIEYDAYYINDSNDRVDVRLQVRCNNIVGIRNRKMVTNGWVYPVLENFTNKPLTNGPTLTLVEAISDWQIITLLDAPTRYSQSNELSPVTLVGIPGTNNTVYSIEFTPDGTMYIGGKFNITYGGRVMNNFCSFKPLNTDAQNILLYQPQTTYNFVSTNYSQAQLANKQGNGIYRTNWLNSAVPYVKYGTFEDEGSIGTSGDASSCKSIVYDYQNECLYVGGDFVSVRNPDNPYTSIQALRIARYNPVAQSFLGFADIGGIVPPTTSYNANIVVNNLTLQYISSGVRLYIAGKWAAVTNNGAGYTAAGKFINTTSFAVANISTITPTTNWEYQVTGGGSFINASPSTFYDVLITSDQRVYAGGDFTQLNRTNGQPTNVTGVAEFRYGSFVDVTRGLEANFYPDNYDTLPSVQSIASDSKNNIYIVGNFSNIQDRLNVDGIARWDGKNFSGMGIYFPPLIKKTLQKVFVDDNDNIFLFTGPNTNKTTIVRTVFSDPSLPASRGVNVIWERLPYSDLKAKFLANELDFEFLNIVIDNGVTSYTYGIVNGSIRLGPSNGGEYFASQETTFIVGKFTHLRIGDSYFRCNNIVAMRYDENQHPFPYKILVFSNAGSHDVNLPDLRFLYDDMMGFSETNAILGVNVNSNITDGQIYSIEVRTKTVDGITIPDKLYIGGRFDFFAISLHYGTNKYTSNRIKNLFVIELESNNNNTDLQFNFPSNNEKNISVPYVNHSNYVYIGQVGVLTNNDAVYTLRSSVTWGGGRTDPYLLFIGGDFITVTTYAGSTLPTRRLAVLPTESGYFGVVKYKLCHINLGNTTAPAGASGAISGLATYSANIYVKGLGYTYWAKPSGSNNTVLIVGGRFTSLGDGTTTTSMNAIGRYYIVASPAVAPTVDTVATLSANISAAPIVTDIETNTNEFVYLSGDFAATVTTDTGPPPVTYTQRNMLSITGNSASSTITLTGQPSDYMAGPNSWEAIYHCVNGLPFGTSRVFQQQLTGAVMWAGLFSGSTGNLFPDATVLLYNGSNAFATVNYAYANLNTPQAVVSIGAESLKQPERKLMQTPATDVGEPIEITTRVSAYSISIPYQNATNTLYNAVVLQEFNCYNTGTTSVYPTITLFCPYKGSLNTAPYYHVVNNVTTRQSLYLALSMTANEIIRIRTERERISVISNFRGDITNSILNSRNTSSTNSNDAQIFRLIPGKNEITYGPSFPMQRCFYKSGLTSIEYNNNTNIIVPPVVLSLSWSIGFNSIHDANMSDTNPLLLL